MEQCIGDAVTIDDRHLPLLADAAFGPESMRDAKERALQQRLSPIYKQILPVCLNEARRARATAEHMLVDLSLGYNASGKYVYLGICFRFKEITKQIEGGEG